MFHHLRAAACLLPAVLLLGACSAPAADPTTAPSGSAAAPAPSGEQTIIKIAYGTAGGPIHEAAEEFEKRVEAANPNIDVQVFPGGQLGSEGEIIGQLQSGLTDILPTTTGPLGQYDPAWYALEAPFVFLNTDQAEKALDGEAGQTVLKSLESIGLLGITYWENGFREMTNNAKPIQAPEDLKGLKFRTQQNQLHIKYFTDLGANPTPLPFTEIYNSLATKVVDGQENPFSLIATNKFYEQQKYVSKTDHVYSAVPVFVSKARWDSWPADVQELVSKTLVELQPWQRDRGRTMEDEYIKEMESASEVLILTDEQKAAFQAAAQPAYEWAAEEYGEKFTSTLTALQAAAQG